MTTRRFLPKLTLVGAQLAGLVCVLTWQRMPIGIGPVMWAIGVVVLFPGNLLASMLVAKIFWQSPLSNASLSVIGLLLTLAINALIWLIVFRTVQALLWQNRRAAAKLRRRN